MPEGHTIHRLAQDHRRLLAVGAPLRVVAPQGWAAAVEAAAVLDGRVLRDVDAYGKHLLYRFAGVDEALHVHLGLFGRFRTFRRRPWPEPRPTTRLRIEAPDAVVHLSGAVASGLLDPVGEDALLARLGPDPLRSDADPAAFARALSRRRIPIGAALMDQSVVAGIGNAYRAEVLRACGLDPWRSSRTLSSDEVGALWNTMASQLRAGVRARRITPRHVYRRRRCGVCGGATRQAELAARTQHWCPACQPAVSVAEAGGVKTDGQPPVCQKTTASPRA